MLTALEQIQSGDYDWVQAFGFAGEPSTYADDPDIQSLDDSDSSSFAISDVCHVEHIAEGENDELDWVCVGSLVDGRWFYLSSGCDYTGWD